MVDVNKGFMRQAVNDYGAEAIRLVDDVRAVLLPERLPVPKPMPAPSRCGLISAFSADARPANGVTALG